MLLSAYKNFASAFFFDSLHLSELTSRVLLSPVEIFLLVFFFPFYFFLICPALPHLHFFFICHVLAVLFLPCPSHARIPCRYKLPPQQQFLHGAPGCKLLGLHLSLTCTDPLLLPLTAGTSCHPSSTSTWNPRALWYCLTRPAPSQ